MSDDVTEHRDIFHVIVFRISLGLRACRRPDRERVPIRFWQPAAMLM